MSEPTSVLDTTNDVAGINDDTVSDNLTDDDTNDDASDETQRVFMWETPPAPLVTGDRGRKVSSYWLSVAEVLAENTGAWAKIAVVDTLGKAAGLATRVRTGHSAAFRPTRHFEAVYRTTGDNEYGVWARHVGEPVPDADEGTDVTPDNSANGVPPSPSGAPLGDDIA